MADTIYLGVLVLCPPYDGTVSALPCCVIANIPIRRLEVFIVRVEYRKPRVGQLVEVLQLNECVEDTES